MAKTFPAPRRTAARTAIRPTGPMPRTATEAPKAGSSWRTPSKAVHIMSGTITACSRVTPSGMWARFMSASRI